MKKLTKKLKDVELIVKKENVAILREEAGKLVLQPKAEDAIVRIWQLQQILEEALDFAKQRIAEVGLATNPNFKSIVSDKVRGTFQAYGARYKLQENVPIDHLLVGKLIEQKCSYSVVTDAVDAYVDKYGQLPEGINAIEREKKMSLTPKKQKGEATNE